MIAQKRGRALKIVLAAALIGSLVACRGSGDSGGPNLTKVLVLSSAPERVTGGDALVEVTPRSSATPLPFSATLNGSDVTSTFRTNPVNGTRLGLVKGLRIGENKFIAIVDGEPTSVTLTNYPANGPVFSGPWEKPFFCQTEQFTLPDGTKLGSALDPDCSAATKVVYVYKSTTATTANSFKPLPSLTTLPSDMAQTTISTGATVPFVVRVENGTVNRAIYQIAMLHDPTTSAPDPLNPSSGWNKRLIYTFGGGCINGWYVQGTTTGGVIDDFMLGKGYAVASSSLNVFGNNCQDVTAAESMMMVKEKFIENYGVPKHTQGYGCSGGSYQQHQIVDNYPGLLDGIIPGCSFPEVGFATINMISDSRLLNAYYKTLPAAAMSDEQKRAAAGVGNLETLANVAVGAGRITPTEFCPAALPVDQRYNAATNPKGVRCDVYDHTVNIYGRDPATGFARRPLDNVGIQYGLAALNSGAITTTQFLDLNERIGGYDNDGNIVAKRTSGDTAAMRAAYQSGRLTNGGGGLAQVPIIDYRAYNDLVKGGDIHIRYHTFSMRERLVKANGTAANQVSITEDNRYSLYSTASPLLRQAITWMDQWLTTLAADASNDSRINKILRAKPTELTDMCLKPGSDTDKIVETVSATTGQCNTLYPAFPSPRMVAAGPLSSDIIKCQLKPVDSADYKVTFSTAEMSRLASVFVAGVCDWTKPGVEQQKLSGTWLSF